MSRRIGDENTTVFPLPVRPNEPQLIECSLRGRRQTVERDHGVFVFPDTHAMGAGPQPQHLYTVRFAARELWGPDASPRDHVYLDLFEAYLDPA